MIDLSDFVEVPGYADYLINKKGDIYSTKTDKFLSLQKDKDGYCRAAFTVNGKTKTYKRHRLVLMTFSPDPGYETLQVNHKNGIKEDNRIENLEWCTATHNVRHAVDMGLNVAKKGTESKLASLSKVDLSDIHSLACKGLNGAEIARELNLLLNAVVPLLRGRSYKEEFREFKAQIDSLKEKELKGRKERWEGLSVSLEETEEILERYFSKRETVSSLSEKYGISPRVITDMTKKVGRDSPLRVKRRITGEGARSGQKNGRSKLNPTQVMDIIRDVEELGITVSATSKKFGVSRAVINDIRRGVTWSQITGRVFTGIKRK